MLARSSKPLGSFLLKESDAVVFYTRKLSHFVQILDFIPKMLDAKGNPRQPSELKTLHFSSGRESAAALAVLNSTLFYWYLNVVSDCRNLNRREFEVFPFDLSILPGKMTAELGGLGPRLMRDIDAHSKMISMNYAKHGRMEIQCVYPRFSKSIIDEIDTVLGLHYGYTGEELDFIINYDIKYRLGSDADER